MYNILTHVSFVLMMFSIFFFGATLDYDEKLRWGTEWLILFCTLIVYIPVRVTQHKVLREKEGKVGFLEIIRSIYLSTPCMLFILFLSRHPFMESPILFSENLLAQMLKAAIVLLFTVIPMSNLVVLLFIVLCSGVRKQ